MRLPNDTIHGMILSVANDPPLLLHEIFEAVARRFPDRTAIDVPPSSSRPARLLYPNRTHAIKEGDNTTRHIFETLTRYLKENLPSA